MQTFIDENLWDEARVFKGKVEFKKGVKAPGFNRKEQWIQTIETDELKIYSSSSDFSFSAFGCETLEER